MGIGVLIVVCASSVMRGSSCELIDCVGGPEFQAVRIMAPDIALLDIALPSLPDTSRMLPLSIWRANFENRRTLAAIAVSSPPPVPTVQRQLTPDATRPHYYSESNSDFELSDDIIQAPELWRFLTTSSSARTVCTASKPVDRQASFCASMKPVDLGNRPGSVPPN